MSFDAVRTAWEIPNHSPAGGTITIRGWDFGGDGPAVLLHHANGLCAAPWALVARGLTSRFRVFAMDARGHGGSDHLAVPSDYAWTSFVADAVEVTRAILAATNDKALGLAMGSSFGGIVLAATQARLGASIERVIMLDPPLRPTEALLEAIDLDMTLEEQRPGLVEQTLRRRAVWPSRKAIHEAYRDKPLFAPWRDEAFDLYVEHGFREANGEVVLNCHPTVEAHIFETTGSLGVLDYAHDVSAPLLLVHARDGFLPEGFLRGVAGLFDDGEYAQIDAGHMLPLEAPERVLQTVKDWLRRRALSA